MSTAPHAVRFVLLSLFAVPVFAQDRAAPTVPKHLLRMAHVVGQEAYFCQAMDMTTKMQMGERTMDMGQSTMSFFTSTAKSVEGAYATIEQKFTRVKAKVSGMAQVDYDSNDPESRPGPLGALEEMVGESITLVMTDRGKVMGSKPSAGFPTESLERSGMDLNQMLAQCVPEFPDQPIAIGESWVTEMKMPMGQMGDIHCKITNRLVEVEKGKAKLDQAYEFDTKDVQLPGGMQLKVDKGTGWTLLDLALGLPLDSQSTIEMSMTGGPGGGMNMQMAMQTVTKRVDAQAAKEAPVKTEPVKAEPVKTEPAKSAEKPK